MDVLVGQRALRGLGDAAELDGEGGVAGRVAEADPQALALAGDDEGETKIDGGVRLQRAGLDARAGGTLRGGVLAADGEREPARVVVDRLAGEVGHRRERLDLDLVGA